MPRIKIEADVPDGEFCRVEIPYDRMMAHEAWRDIYRKTHCNHIIVINGVSRCCEIFPNEKPTEWDEKGSTPKFPACLAACEESERKGK